VHTKLGNGQLHHRLLWTVLLACLIATVATAQPQKGGGGANPASTNAGGQQSTGQTSSSTPSTSTTGGGGAGLQGLSYFREDWDDQLGQLPDFKALGLRKKEDLVYVCYRLVPGLSATQPFMLEPLVVHPDTKTSITATCSNITPIRPLLMDQMLVVAVDASAVTKLPQTFCRLKILNINITNQQGASLNPTPIRPSIAAATATGSALSGGVAPSATVSNAACVAEQHKDAYYLTWPNQIPGDAIPTVSVNLVYTPVAPGLPWVANTFYPAGSIVILPEDAVQKETKVNGHYYIALSSFISSTSPITASKPTDAAPVETFPDGGGAATLTWTNIGNAPYSMTPGSWQAGQMYLEGSQIVPPAGGNGHYCVLHK